MVEKYLAGEKAAFVFQNGRTVNIKTIEKSIPGFIFGLSKAGVRITDINVTKPTLEDVFLDIARGGAADVQ